MLVGAVEVDVDVGVVDVVDVVLVVVLLGEEMS